MEGWRMTWAVVWGIYQGNNAAMGIIMLVDSKILGFEKFEDRPSSAKS
jgi:hypothetical protein